MSPTVVVFDYGSGNVRSAVRALERVGAQVTLTADAAVALSPLTDATMSSPSVRANIATDPMLGPMFGPMARIPQWALLWLGWLQTRIRPSDPLVSPLRARLC